MFKPLSIVACLLLLTLTSAAQESTVTMRTISVPFVMPQFALSPDGATLAVFEEPVVARNEVTPATLPILLIDVATGEQTATLDGAQTDLIRDAVFSPDGARLVSYHTNGQLIVWDVASAQPIQQFDWLPFGGGFVDWLPGTETVVVSASSGQLAQHTLFDLTTGSIVDGLAVRPASMADFQASVRDPLAMGAYGLASVAAADGVLYGATPDGDVFAWDINTRTRTVLSDAPDDARLRFNVRGLQVLGDGSLVFYDGGTGATVYLAPDGTRTGYPFGSPIFAASDDGTVAFWQRDDDTLYLARVDASESPRALELDIDADLTPTPFKSLAFTADGALILAGMLDSGGIIYVIERQ